MISGVGVGLFFPNGTLWVLSLAPPRLRGRVVGGLTAAIFLAQFRADDEPFNGIDAMARWAANLGFTGIQVPIGNPTFIDVAIAAQSQAYCDELKGRVADAGVQITELSTHLEGQLVAVHPAYDELFDAFATPAVRGNPKARTAWAVEQVKLALHASARLGLTEQVAFSGALLFDQGLHGHHLQLMGLGEFRQLG